MERVNHSETEMQAFREVAPKMFQKLNNHVNGLVQYVYWICGNKCKSTAVLTMVDDFDSAVFFQHKLPFIGNKCAVISINSARTGELLYYNPFVDVADYPEKTPEEVRKLKEKLFDGVGFVKDDIDAKIDKYLLVRGGALVVKSELVEEWYEYVMNNEKIGFNQVTEIVLSGLQRLQQGAFCSEVYSLYGNQEFDDDEKAAISDGIVYFTSRSHEFENYLKNKGKVVGDKRKNGSFVRRVLEPIKDNN